MERGITIIHSELTSRSHQRTVACYVGFLKFWIYLMKPSEPSSHAGQVSG